MPTGTSGATADTTLDGASTTGGGFGSGLGAIFTSALDTAAQFGTGLLQLDLLKRAQSTGVVNTATTTNQTAGTQTAGTGGAAAGSASGLPDWAMPVGIAAGVAVLLILIVVMVKN